MWTGWSLIQRTLKSLWQDCQCLQWALDRAPRDSQKHSKGNYFSLVMPSWQQFPQRAQLAAYFDRSPGNIMYSMRKPDDRRCWILLFDTFPVEMCWFPSSKCFWINFMWNWGPLQGQAAPLPLHWRCSSTMPVLSSVEKHGGWCLGDKGCMIVQISTPPRNSGDSQWLRKEQDCLVERGN